MRIPVQLNDIHCSCLRWDCLRTNNSPSLCDMWTGLQGRLKIIATHIASIHDNPLSAVTLSCYTVIITHTTPTKFRLKDISSEKKEPLLCEASHIQPWLPGKCHFDLLLQVTVLQDKLYNLSTNVIMIINIYQPYFIDGVFYNVCSSDCQIEE